MNPLHMLLAAIDGDQAGMAELRKLDRITREMSELQDVISRLYDDFTDVAEALNDKYEAEVNVGYLHEQFENGNYDPEELQ